MSSSSAWRHGTRRILSRVGWTSSKASGTRRLTPSHQTGGTVRTSLARTGNDLPRRHQHHERSNAKEARSPRGCVVSFASEDRHSRGVYRRARVRLTTPIRRTRSLVPAPGNMRLSWQPETLWISRDSAYRCSTPLITRCREATLLAEDREDLRLNRRFVKHRRSYSCNRRYPGDLTIKRSRRMAFLALPTI